MHETLIAVTKSEINLLFFFITAAPAVHITVEEINSQSRLVNFTCTSTGNPLPLITWQSSRENITESYSHTIEGTLSNPPRRVSILERQATTALETYNCTGSSVYGGITWTATDSVLLNGGKILQCKIYQ